MDYKKEKGFKGFYVVLHKYKIMFFRRRWNNTFSIFNNNFNKYQLTGEGSAEDGGQEQGEERGAGN